MVIFNVNRIGEVWFSSVFHFVFHNMYLGHYLQHISTWSWCRTIYYLILRKTVSLKLFEFIIGDFSLDCGGDGSDFKLLKGSSLNLAFLPLNENLFFKLNGKIILTVDDSVVEIYSDLLLFPSPIKHSFAFKICYKDLSLIKYLEFFTSKHILLLLEGKHFWFLGHKN